MFFLDQGSLRWFRHCFHDTNTVVVAVAVTRWTYSVICWSEVKEVGLSVEDCSCLAQDAFRIFWVYWSLAGATKGSLPPYWPAGLSALSSSHNPLHLNFNGAPARVYLSVSSELGFKFPSGGVQYKSFHKMRIFVFNIDCDVFLKGWYRYFYILCLATVNTA